MSDIVNQAVDYEVDGRTFQGHLLYLRGASPSRGLLMAPNFFGVSDAAPAHAARGRRKSWAAAGSANAAC